MRSPDAVFNLLNQMRQAKPGQRIVTQGRLDLSVQKVHGDDDRPRSVGQGGDPEPSNEDRDQSAEQST